MKHVLFFAIAICISTQLFAQLPVFDWARKMGGTNSDEGTSIAIDQAGNVYTTGSFSGTVDFDPGPGVYNLSTIVGDPGTFISKLDASGNFVWAKSMDQAISSSAWGSSITIDAIGNIYTTGNFSGTIDFDPGPGVFNLSSFDTIVTDIFVSKLDSSGNFIWAKQITSSIESWGYASCISTDDSGNVFTTGNFHGTVDFDPGPGNFNFTIIGYDIFISKLDSSGNFVWAKEFAGTNFTRGSSIIIDVFGNVYTTGLFGSTTDFDPGPGHCILTSEGYQDIFISKLNSSGDFIWAKRIGGADWDLGLSVTSDSSGNVYMTGSFEGTVDFDPGPGTFTFISSGGGYRNPFISKFDSSGNFIWAKHIEATSAASGVSITTDIHGDVYATGNFFGTADFDPGPATFNLTSTYGDAFVIKLDSSGNFIWAGQMGGNAQGIYGWGNSVIVNAAGEIYIAGGFYGTVDFDPGTGIYNLTSTTQGYSDVFVQKMIPSPVGIIENNFSDDFVLFPNPTNGNFTIYFAKQTDVVIREFSITGQLISGASEKNVNTLNYNINAAPGFYIVEIKTSDGRWVRTKVIKE